MKNLSKTLHFNEKEINLVFADGQWWVAVKPICEALGVNFEKQRERISRSKLLGQLPTKRGVVAADGKTREMLCLPEKYTYGWLASINSDSEELLEFQKECYDVLFNHFHGRFSALVERLQIDERIAELETILAGNEHYDEIKELHDRKKKIAPALRKMDNDLLKGQIRLDLG
jgi:hypothetical protein